MEIENPQTNEQLPRMTRKILVGRNTDANLIYVLEIDTTRGHFAITYDGFESVLLTNESGEELARESLEDGEMWRDAVANDRTQDSLEDWNEQVIAQDGWDQVVGDINYVGEKDGEEYYSSLTSCGAGNGKDYLDINELKITKKELKQIAKAVDTLHLKNFDGSGTDKPEHGRMFQNMTAEEIQQAKQVIAIFNKYPEFNNEDLLQYVEEFSV
jgi:hypothetical protein